MNETMGRGERPQDPETEKRQRYQETIAGMISKLAADEYIPRNVIIRGPEPEDGDPKTVTLSLKDAEDPERVIETVKALYSDGRVPVDGSFVQFVQ